MVLMNGVHDDSRRVGRYNACTIRFEEVSLYILGVGYRKYKLDDFCTYEQVMHYLMSLPELEDETWTVEYMR